MYRPPKCNCPDAISKRGAIPGAQAFSEQYPSDWSSGFVGIKSVGGFCIHEMAVIRIRKEVGKAFPDGIPKDLPAPVPPKYVSNASVYKLQEPSILGDDFSI
jgi:hypothetical protein